MDLIINEHTVDFAALWRTYKQQDENGRVAPEVDLAFWEQAASDYDHSHPVYPNVLTVLESVIRPDDTILDVGAGTGRFTLPLAQHVRQVTALDHSAVMLNRLCQKKNRLNLNNIELIEAAWEQAVVEPHDVVLVAWSLYRQVDILSALQKLVDATRRTLIIVESDDDARQYPHHYWQAKIWGKPAKQSLAKYLVFQGALWQLDIQAEVRIVYETGEVMAESPPQLARQLAPDGATMAEVERFAQYLHPLLKQKAAQWHYRFTHPVEMLIWQR